MKFSSNFIKASDKMCDFDKPVAAPYFRKSFNLDFVPDKAEITICGLGFYELYINGENITKGPLAPYISNPDHICYYDNYDISDKLKCGRNVIGILLGNGMRNAFGGFVWDFDKASFRGPVCVALCLEAISGETGFELEADETFKTYPSPIFFDDLRMGCHYDARLETPGWETVGFDDSEWSCARKSETPAGRPVLSRAEAIKVYREIKPVCITHFDEMPFAYESMLKTSKPVESTIRKNVYVYDFGENNAGVTMLKINGHPGQKVTIRHMEYLINGFPAINTIAFNRPGVFDKYIEYAQKDVYICSGGEECFIPKFKYDGFRYAFVEGLEPEQATTEALTFLVMSSDIKERADFECSCDILNKLQEMTKRSDRSNFYYFPTDCPQREKNGWTADAAVSAEQMLLNFDAANSLEVWLENIRMAQNCEGSIPGIIPTGEWGYHYYGPAWDSICVMLPYYIYKFEGDKKVIYDNASMILRYFYYQKGRYTEDGLIDHGLGDWCAPFKREDNTFLSPRKFTSSTVAYDAAVKAAFLFEQIDQKAEANYIMSIAADLKKNIRNTMIDFDTMTAAGECQTSQALAMQVGIFNNDEYEKAGRRLIEIIEKDGYINTCGVIGLRVIYHVLSSIGKYDLAYKLISSKERSCYGAWVKNEATTLLENFPHEDGTGTCSQNHHFLGDISSWFIQDIAGLKPNSNMTDVSEFELSPHFLKELDFAKAYFISKFGKLGTEWRKNANEIELTITIPEGMHGSLKLDKGYVVKNGEDGNLTAGMYRFEIVKL